MFLDKPGMTPLRNGVEEFYLKFTAPFGRFVGMRRALGLVGGLLVGFVGWTGLSAQTNAPAATPPSAPPQDGGRQAMMGFLPQADQDRVMSAYNKAMADNAPLKDEADNLMQQAQDLQDASPEDRQAFVEKLRLHQEKVRKAMLKEDPTLTPVLDTIDKHISELRAKREKEMIESGGGGAPAGH